MHSLDRARRQLTRRRFLAGGAVTLASLSLYSGELERHALTVARRTIKIANLPTAFHGFRVAQISDIHYRSFDEPYFVEHAVRQINMLEPDMVALTGDFITAHRVPGNSVGAAATDANECASILAGIRCPLRFCSLGNHDTVNAAGVLQALLANGLSALNNQHVAIDLRGDRLWVAGIADAYYDVPNLTAALPKRKPSEPVILLGHEPDFADTIAPYGPVDLMLAGHTHGGQIRLPLLPAMFLPAMGLKYVSGLYHVGKTQLYVNRGLGTMHLPFRFNCPPELTLMTLLPG
ncbi:MAG: metallophosphoesterase [Janthinobacterium lividum]